ncbi:alkanesulfonate monooxygenase SsuD/methylene tetrahydromethanopterin reductase-like flavin-dependent oxidoreductase (luciferase family) [Humibacillus xanthopallidus]|uniref:Alkanesulfonate monooxygenase SsuD/methylene tetrahydromethanopterin reductase-like flavin-dependent oxidoreductase (Luciferase family) n=1 Tax=Humibacillus xanthopallidus TaxID=412689 RepID=A0A543PR76_9MICO|nr:LLM class flavin-dependent oxidoreductase [Humibacillus xanthopallidus]TQN46564.1 alkanesulfonate monooxygenase SsuD/methylene tetrahydromethanopterin reductase-like flavin-dependent oxidoreductase (luciferase family) [Humibacillus xanthopallidus]
MSTHDVHPEPLHLAVALDGAGWHPAAWREPGARSRELFTAAYWADVAAIAERGLLDFVTIEDSLVLQSNDPFADRADERTDQVRGRLDAVLVAASIAPLTRHIGLVPTVTTTHTEPFHTSKSLATLDHVSRGRGGWRVQAGGANGEAGHFGRRVLPSLGSDYATDPKASAALRARFDEAADHVEVVRRLWDSWEDDAEIRDVETGRFIDRDKLHYIDFEGEHFSVRGPSITPRPPQGQPVVAALAHQTIPYELAARSTDVVFVTPHDDEHARSILAEVRDAEARVEQDRLPLKVFADLVVVIGASAAAAQERRRRLDEVAGAPFTSDALIVTGTAAELAELLRRWQDIGYAGFRLRPAVITDDLTAIVDDLVPELQAAGRFRTAYAEGTLRERLGLPATANRYAVTTPV